MKLMKDKAFFVSCPHSGEKIPENVKWLDHLPEPHLMRDVDRYVDQLYQSICESLAIPFIKSEWHRYVIDLNRLPEDYDAQSVLGASLPINTHPRGLHWSVTTFNEVLIQQPMSMDLHLELVKNIYREFHDRVQAQHEKNKIKFPVSYQLDVHSMPSKGTSMHKDPGKLRADVVISDFIGKSCSSRYLQIVKTAFAQQGFKVAYNDPYIGGGVTQLYGKPSLRQECIQVELNRALYMDEESKKKNSQFFDCQKRLAKAIEAIWNEL